MVVCLVVDRAYWKCTSHLRVIFSEINRLPNNSTRLRERGELGGTVIKVNLGDIIKNPEI